MTTTATINLTDRAFLLAAVRAQDPTLNQTLRQAARARCDEIFGREVYLRGLIEFSNICRRNCAYCGLYTGNSNIERYRMTPEAIVERAGVVRDLGFATVVLQSGEDPWFTLPILCDIVRRIKAETGLVVTLSIGEMPFGDYKALREAGADRYLLRHETSNPELYAKLHPGHTLATRLDCLKSIRDCGYELGTGFMVGLPGQTDEDLLADLDLLVKLQADMVGIGPFIANPDTPLAGSADGNIEVVLNLVALIRLLLPGANIPATTALDSLRSDGRELGLNAGANVVMPIMTPPDVKTQYRLYPNKRCLDHDPTVCSGCTRRRLEAGGYTHSFNPGWSKQRQMP